MPSDPASLDWPAPAKINLMLRVLGRRDDGYHELQTVFQFIDLCDRLDFTLRRDGCLRLTQPLPGVEPELDLTLRAARLLQDHCNTRLGADIALHKHLPMGGGLGGGSSDAATVLVALNQLWHCGLNDQTLRALGLRLGADVPIFLFGRAAWGEGVGEQLTPIAPPERWILLVLPDCRVATAAVFQHRDLTRNSAPETIRGFLEGSHVNDCTALVRQLHPPVAAALDWLGNFAEARVTGTGATVFAEFDDQRAAAQAQASLAQRYRTHLVKASNRSPLLARLARSTDED